MKRARRPCYDWSGFRPHRNLILDSHAGRMTLPCGALGTTRPTSGWRWNADHVRRRGRRRYARRRLGQRASRPLRSAAERRPYRAAMVGRARRARRGRHGVPSLPCDNGRAGAPRTLRTAWSADHVRRRGRSRYAHGQKRSEWLPVRVSSRTRTSFLTW